MYTAGFITSKRSADTTVLVKDNQTVVTGGLIGTTDTSVATKVPILETFHHWKGIQRE